MTPEAGVIYMNSHLDAPFWMKVDALHILTLDEPTFNHKDMGPMVLPGDSSSLASIDVAHDPGG